MFTRLRLPLATLLCSFLAGCGLSGSYPSLAPRPEELGRAPQPKVSLPPTAAPDPALGEQLNRLLASAQEGDRAFRAERTAVERAVGRAGASGSDSWAEAQQALSRLEASRTPTAVAAAELEALTRAKVEAAPSAAVADIGAITAAAEQVRALIRDQDQVIDELTSRLGGA